MNKKDELKYAQAAMQWHGWGSPVGLGLFLISLALVALIATIAINNLTDAGQKGINISEQQMRLEQQKK